MIKLQKYLKPAFLSRLDKWLLLHKPVLWSTRFITALFYGLGFLLLIVLAAFAITLDPRENADPANWEVILSVLSLLAFICWLIYVFRFNVFKRFGRWNQLDGIKTFLLYFIVILVFISWPFIPRVVQSLRADRMYGTQELANDVNNMNRMICQLEMDSLDTEFEQDTIRLSGGILGIDSRRYSIDGELRTSDEYHIADSLNFHIRLEAADSVRMLTDSMFIAYTCPDFQFVSSWRFSAEAGDRLWESMRLYREILANRKPVNREQVRNQLQVLIQKYTANLRNAYSGYYPYTAIDESRKNDQYWNRLHNRYSVRLVNVSLDNISEKKYRLNASYLEVISRVAFYIALMLTLFVFTYRHTTRRTFFLSLLALVVISILTIVLISASGTSDSFEWSFLVCFLLFTAFSLGILTTQRRNLVQGIALNLFVWTVTFLPLVVVSLYYQHLRQYYLYSGDVENKAYHDFLEMKHWYYSLAEIAGFVLLSILVATVIQRLYKRWYALPEQ